MFNRQTEHPKTIHLWSVSSICKWVALCAALCGRLLRSACFFCFQLFFREVGGCWWTIYCALSGVRWFALECKTHATCSDMQMTWKWFWISLDVSEFDDFQLRPNHFKGRRGDLISNFNWIVGSPADENELQVKIVSTFSSGNKLRSTWRKSLNFLISN